MSDIHQVIDKIRAFLNSEVGTLRDDLKQLAEDYAKACTEANERLKKCERLLQQGLRTEALHAAEAKPGLLELVAALQFPERAEWVETVLSHDLTAPPVLFLDSAAALNEAYAQHDPLADLLRRHHLLVLSRAPLSERIAILAQIAERDPDTPHWEDDLRSYQKVRLRQIAEEVTPAANRRDIAVLNGLVQELDAPHWLESPPSNLVQGVKATAAKVRRAEARAALATLADQLNDAFAEFDVEIGRLLRARWGEHSEDAQLTRDDPLYQKAEPALSWLAGQDRQEHEAEEYQRAVLALEAALDEEADRPTLEQLVAAIHRFEMAMPEALQRRLEARFETLDREARRRKQIILGACATGAVMLLVAILGVMRSGARQRHIAETVAAADRFVQQGDPDGARDFVRDAEAAHPGIAGATEIGEVKARIGGERRRVDQLQGLLKEARDALSSATEPASLGDARRLARTDDEKARVSRLANERAKHWRAILADHDRELQPRVTALDTQVTEVESRLRQVEPLARLTAAFELARKDYAPLIRDTREASEQLREKVAEFGKRLDRAEQGIQRQTRMEAGEASMTRAICFDGRTPVRDASAYATAVQQFLDQSPDSPRAPQLRESLKERAAWESALAWNELLRTWRNDHRDLDSPKGARAVSDDVKKYLDTYKSSPDGATARRLRQCAEATLARPSALQELTRVFRAPLMNLSMIRTQANERYYTKSEPLIDLMSTRSQQFEYIHSFDLNDLRSGIKQGLDIKAIGPAPQKAIARDALKILDASANSWEADLVAILERIRKDREVDALLQADLLKRVAEAAGKGSVPLSEALEKMLVDLKAVNTLVPWMDPRDTKAHEARLNAARMIARLSDFQAILKQGPRNSRCLELALASDLQPVGWIARDPNGWICRIGQGRPETSSESELWMVEPDSNGSLTWQRIGVLSGGRASLSVAEPNRHLSEGRPIFAGKRSTEGT
jgi:hypothetical protein